MHNQKSFLENERHKFLLYFEIQTDHLFLAGRVDLIIINKKGTFQHLGYCFLTRQQSKIEKSEKKDEYKDLARELKKCWNIIVMVVLLVISTLSTIIKGLKQGQEDLEITGRMGIIQTTALLRSATKLRSVMYTCRK